MQHVFHADAEAILAQLPCPRPRVVMAPSLAGQAAKLVEAVLPSWMMRLMVVSDIRTHAALGVRVEDELMERYALKRVMLQGEPSPTNANVMELLRQSDICDAIIAVGSGTINDLCKQVAHLAKKPYVVFPTAPSMNGYTSANASIIVNDVKQSFAATLPVLIACDMATIARAPFRLIRAGLGDSVARPTAQADWLMSHLLRGTPYDGRPFAMLTPYETKLFENAAALVSGDIAAIQTLMEVLLLSGFGMTLAGGSYPASQGEHMIAHTYEMLAGVPLNHSATPQPLHGEQIGVTTLTMARLQEEVLFHASDLSHQSAAAVEGGNSLSKEHIEQIRAVMLPSEHIESVLRAAGCPTTPAELGWDAALYQKAVETAHTIRDRFTFLNLR